MKLTALTKTTVFTVTIFLSIVYYGSAEKKIDFNRDIQPVLSNYCYSCHGPDKEHRKANLRLDLRTDAIMEKDGMTAIVPGFPEKSAMIAKILHKDPEDRMPPLKTNKKMRQRDIETLKTWIKQGAEYRAHWSFVPPLEKEKTKFNHQNWAKNSIDHYIIQSLQNKGLKPSNQADKRTLIRRLSFDLLGLPPTPSEVTQFIQDKSPNAYEKLVDRLLKSPHYGERMATMWMDAARYGDTSIYYADGIRDMWGWRDLIVDFYNRNLSFDKFSTYQIAGDLLTNPTQEQLIASGFNRNHGTSDEGGIDAEEYRIKFVVDRVNTTASVWLGLTMGCAQCHDHKFDPVTQKDFYRFFAFFNNHVDPGKQSRRGNTAPILYLTDPKNKSQIATLKKEERKLLLKKDQLSLSETPAFESWLMAFKKSPDLAYQLNPTNHIGFDDKPLHTTDNIRLAKPTKGPFGTAMDFSNRALHLYKGIGEFNQTDEFTFNFWINPKDLNHNGTIIAKKHRSKAEQGYSIDIHKGKIVVQLAHHNKNSYIKVISQEKMTLGNWRNITISYDGSMLAKGVRIYVDGELWKTNILSDTLLTNNFNIDQPLAIGATQSFYSNKHPAVFHYNGDFDELKIFSRRLSWPEILSLQKPEIAKQLIKIEPTSKKFLSDLRYHYDLYQSKGYKKITSSLKDLQKKHIVLSKPKSSVMIMGDRKEIRKTYLLSRGVFNKPIGDPLTAGVPIAFPQLDKDQPKNRLGLANWLFSKDNPLTSRVAVNRYWQMIFGKGLVDTANDFGLQGSYPSHPELLDHLAVKFIQENWDIKKMLKYIVMSSTYRQSSHFNPQSKRLDPENTFLSRGPRNRLQAEFIRDNALAVSGLLNRQLKGPGVKPYQPKGVWSTVSRYGKEYKQDHGVSLYRRSLYTYYKRSAPPPNLQIFDAPTREVCVLTRSSTNTPLQAFVTMNDPQYVEAARVLAENVLIYSKGELSPALQLAFKKATARFPNTKESKVIHDVYDKAYTYYSQAPEAASLWVNHGEHKPISEVSEAKLAAMMLCTSMILNLDEVITKE